VTKNVTKRSESVKPNCTLKKNDCQSNINVTFYFEIVKIKNYLYLNDFCYKITSFLSSTIYGNVLIKL